MHEIIEWHNVLKPVKINKGFFLLKFYFKITLVKATILVIIFWNFTIFLYRSESPQVKRSLISIITNLVYELLHKLLNNLRNTGKTPNLGEDMAHCSISLPEFKLTGFNLSRIANCHTTNKYAYTHQVILNALWTLNRQAKIFLRIKPAYFWRDVKEIFKL